MQTRFDNLYKFCDGKTLAELVETHNKNKFLKISNKVEEVINYIESMLSKEAEKDGAPELLDETVLYKRFCINRDNGMMFGNWQILKYFVWKLRIKTCYLMFGQCRFNEHDVEMYNFFRWQKFVNSDKCQPRFLKLHECYKNSLSSAVFTGMFVEPNPYNYATVGFLWDGCNASWPYFDFFHQHDYRITDMINNVLGRPLVRPNEDFFTSTYEQVIKPRA